jgi:hypothetical protein
LGASAARSVAPMLFVMLIFQRAQLLQLLQMPLFKLLHMLLAGDELSLQFN